MQGEQVIYDIGTQYRDKARLAAQTRIVYDLAKADVIDAIRHECLANEIKMNVPQMDAEATRRVAVQMTECREAEADLDGTKKFLDVLHAIHSSCQTRSKLIQIEHSMNGRQV